MIRLMLIRRLVAMIWLVLVDRLVLYEMSKDGEFSSIKLCTKERLKIILSMQAINGHTRH